MDNKGAIGMVLRTSYLQACVMLNGKYLIFAAGQTILYMYTCRLLSTLMKRLRYRQDGRYSEYCRGFPTKDHPKNESRLPQWTFAAMAPMEEAQDL